MYNNFAQLVCDGVNSKKVAVKHDSGSITYAELRKAVKQFAYQLREKKIVAGDKVIILMSDRIEWIIAFLGCMYAGAVPTLVSPLLLAKKFNEAVEISKARAVITDVDTNLISDSDITIFTPKDVTRSSKQLDNAHKFLPDEIALLIPSSGTTGRQKFIAHRHQNFFTYIDKVPAVMALDHSSIVYGTSTLSHIAGLNVTIVLALGMNATAILSNKKVSPTLVYQTMIDNNVTHFHSHPGVFALMTVNVNKSLPIPSLEFAGCFSQKYPEKIALEWEKIYGLFPQNGYGTTETFSLTLLQVPSSSEDRDVSLGQPVPGTQIEIRNDQGQLCERNVIGELYVSSPTSGSYYLNDWNSTKETFVGHWIKTNDLVYQDNDDNIHYVRRSDDVVKINGLLVSMSEVQEAIEQHPDVEECVVQKSTNQHGLDKLSTQIVMKKERSVDTTSIRHFLLEVLEATKVPKYIKVVEDLPIDLVDEVAKTISGKKIYKKELGE